MAACGCSLQILMYIRLYTMNYYTSEYNKLLFYSHVSPYETVMHA